MGRIHLARLLRGSVVVVALVIFCCGSRVMGAISAQASGAYGSGNTSYGSDSVSGYPLGAVDTTGPRGIISDGIDHLSSISAHGQATTNITSNGFGGISASGAWNATANVNTNTNSGYIYFVSSGGGMNLTDTLTVTSPTLPVDTQVVVTFSFHTFFAGSIASSVPNSSQTYGRYLAGVGAGASPVYSFSPDAGNPVNSFYLDSNANKIYDSTYLPYGSGAVGLFAGANHLDVQITAQVGRPINFSVSLTLTAAGGAGPSGLPLTGQSASSTALAGVAFGASAAPAVIANAPGTPTGDLLIESSLLNGAFPSADSVNAGNAAVAAGVVPEPATAFLLGITTLVLVTRRSTPCECS